jgi:hypothetical protein
MQGRWVEPCDLFRTHCSDGHDIRHPNGRCRCIYYRADIPRVLCVMLFCSQHRFTLDDD